MTRNEMISALKAAGIRAVPTVATYDMGLQYDYITPDGAGTGFGGMGSWPLWRFKAVASEQWKRICDAILDEALTCDMLEGTGIDVMLSSVYLVGSQEIDYSDYLSELLEIDMPTDYFYCLHDTGMMFSEFDIPQFFNSEDEAKVAFANAYCRNIESWDDMDDEMIKNWYERINDDLEIMAYMEVEEE